MNKIVLMFLVLASSVVSAEESYTAGETYQGQPIVCRSQKDAADLAEAYVRDGLEELNKALIKKNEKSLCIAGVQVSFTVIKGMSVHKDKEIVYVIEIMSNGIYYIVDPHPVVARTRQRNVPV